MGHLKGLSDRKPDAVGAHCVLLNPSRHHRFQSPLNLSATELNGTSIQNESHCGVRIHHVANILRPRVASIQFRAHSRPLNERAHVTNKTRVFRSGWLALEAGSATPTVGFVEGEVTVGKRVAVEVWTEGWPDGFVSSRQLEYSSSSSVLQLYARTEPYEPWADEDELPVPSDLQARLDALLDDPESDLNELFTALSAASHDFIGEINAAEIEAAPGDNGPAADDVWGPTPGYAIKAVKPSR